MSQDEQGSQQAQGKFIAQADRGSTASVAVYENIFPRPIEQEVKDATILKLAALPLDRLPIVGSLPAGSHPPSFRRNPSFVGREPELSRIASILKEQALATVVVTGIGGMGKTQLATEFVYRYGQFFAGGVFWLSFANADAVRSEVIACQTALEQEVRLDVATLAPEDQVKAVLAAWQNDLPRLLVFDNCEDEALLARWLPPTGGCRILVTSRRALWHPDLGVSVVPLDILPREESMKLLGKYRSDLSITDREAIATELGDLPLALYLAGKYLQEYKESRLGVPATYVVALRRVNPLQHPSLQEQGNTYPTGHREHVARTFALSYEQLDAANAIDACALKLLAHVAFFAPGEPIPRDLLRATMGPEEDDELEDLVVKALKRLHALGLLNQQQENTQQMHRLLVAFVSERIGPTAMDAQMRVEQVVQSRAESLNAAGYPAPMLVLQRHLYVVTERADQREDEMVAHLHSVLGNHLRMIGAYQKAQINLQRALHISEQVLGPEHPSTATVLENYVSFLQQTNRREEAAQLQAHIRTIHAKQKRG